MTPVGAVSNRTASAQLETAPTKRETGQRSWKQRLPKGRLDGAVENSAYQTPGAKVSIYF